MGKVEEEHSSSSHNPSATLDKETEAKPCAVHGGRGKNQTSAPLCFLHADSEAGSATDLQHTLKLRFPVALRTLVVSSPDSGCAREQVVDVPAQQVRGLLRRLVRCGGPQVKGIEVWFQRLKRSGQCGAARRDADLMQQMRRLWRQMQLVEPSPSFVVVVLALPVVVSFVPLPVLYARIVGLHCFVS